MTQKIKGSLNKINNISPKMAFDSMNGIQNVRQNSLEGINKCSPTTKTKPTTPSSNTPKIFGKPNNK